MNISIALYRYIHTYISYVVALYVTAVIWGMIILHGFSLLITF